MWGFILKLIIALGSALGGYEASHVVGPPAGACPTCPCVRDVVLPDGGTGHQLLTCPATADEAPR